MFEAFATLKYALGMGLRMGSGTYMLLELCMSVPSGHFPIIYHLFSVLIHGCLSEVIDMNLCRLGSQEFDNEIWAFYLAFMKKVYRVFGER